MKKLMVAAFAVAFAAAAQAAAFTWTTSVKACGPNIDLANITAGKYSSGSTGMSSMSGVTWTYVMTLSNDSEQSDVLNGTLDKWKSGKINMTSGLASDVMWKPASGDPDNVVDYSIVLVGSYKDANNKEWTFTSDALEGQKAYSDLSALTIASGVPTSWTVAAVPEPTSGLLLLLGMAGLALRRRRA